MIVATWQNPWGRAAHERPRFRSSTKHNTSFKHFVFLMQWTCGAIFIYLYIWSVTICSVKCQESPWKKNNRVLCVLQNGNPRWP